MATLPSAKSSLTDTGGSVATGADVMVIAGPVNSGPQYSVQLWTSSAALLTAYGDGKAQDCAGHYIDQTKKPVVFIGMNPAVAGSLSSVNALGVLGTAVPTVAGVPGDDEQVVVLITTAGTLGTPGIEFQLSRDGGQTYGSITRLGAALTYTIPNSCGIIITFGTSSQTFLLNDTFSFNAYAPQYDSTGVTAVRTALAASPFLSRLVQFVGKINVGASATAQNLSDAVEAYNSTNNRDTRFVGELRSQYLPATMTGKPSLTFATPGNTITRATGSWLADGFAVGMKVSVVGSASNNIVSAPITVLTATVLTTSTALVNETTAVATVTAVENENDWMAALDAITIGQVWQRVVLGGGDGIRTSPIYGFRKKRNAAWAMVNRYMQHDVQVSPADRQLGRLKDWTIYDANNKLICHDERSNGGLLHSRITCLTSDDTDLGGTFVALALTLATDNRPLSRLPVACVGDITETICRVQTTKLLNSRCILDPKTGYLTTAEKRRIEGTVLTKLQNELLTQKTEGQRASAVTFSISNTTDLRQPGAIVSWESDVTALGYLEQLSGTVRVQGAAA